MKYIKEYAFFKEKEGIDINTIRDILLDLEDKIKNKWWNR